ncbi:MAG TPA: hypothetical protein PKM41_15885 [Deltaproteobacteria bacterium]|nr:hypothetical protein [Deltaproteobacteria bacterium]HOI08524.1 hypothetical protein [Deltaproteobacteria bacterium]
MKRRFSFAACALVVLLASSMLMGMSGGMGTAPSGNQAVPGIAYDAKLMDVDNNVVQLSSVTIDAKTAFQANMGKGKVIIPFDQISRIEIKGKTACVTLKNSQRMCNLTIKELSRVYGSTSFGAYQISLADVAWIELTKAKQ